MYNSFFPDPILAWVYLTTLTIILSVASYIDYRHFTIPKWLSLSTLAIGLVINMIRGAWLGSTENAVWVLGENGLIVGIVDGILFSVTGLLVAFALYFSMWIMNICGGGDVKIAAAIGAWVGPGLVLWVFAGTIITVSVITTFMLIWKLLSGQGFKRPSETLKKWDSADKSGKPKKGRISFSLPLAIACVLVLAWMFRADLQLTDNRPSPTLNLQSARK